MSTSKALIDFTDLVSKVPGEGLEELVRHIGRKKGLSPTWSGRGADGGRDLVFIENLEGSLSRDKVTWVVSCKDKAKSGDSVNERDLPATGVRDKLEQHDADGFLLVTTTTISTGAKALLDKLDKSNGGDIRTLVWDSSELEAMLLSPEYHDLLQQFLPSSYENIKKFTSLEGAVLAFRDRLPSEVLSEIMRIVHPYSELDLRGKTIWPYDNKSADMIDRIVKRLIIDEDVEAAVEETEDLGSDAFVALATKLQDEYQDDTLTYLLAISTKHGDTDIRFNAAQAIFDNYEVSDENRMLINLHLDNNALEQLYEGDIKSYVYDEIFHNTPDYELYQSLEDIHGGTAIDDMDVSDLVVTADLTDKRVRFNGSITIEATFVMDGEDVGGHSFPGTFSGYFNEYGMQLEQANIDTTSYYGLDDDDIDYPE